MIVNLHCGLIRNQRFRSVCKVFHMRTKHNRFACEDRFHRILSPVRGEALPDKHHRGDAVPALKFTRGIEKNAIRIGCARVERFTRKLTRNPKAPKCARISCSRST